MYLSTLRGFIEAMGGKLEIIARFPNQAVRITQFELLGPEQRPQGQEMAKRTKPAPQKPKKSLTQGFR